jgi:hypothetical protein
VKEMRGEKRRGKGRGEDERREVEKSEEEGR